MTDKTTHHIYASEREFSELKGDGTESVKMTPDWDRKTHTLNGWYLFLKTPEGRNSFVKQSLTNLPLIDRIFCDTKYFQFDRNEGLLPDSFHYDYNPVGLELESHRQEYESLKAKLEQAGLWRPIRKVIEWKFVDETTAGER
jgi:hypothetical protein